MKQKYIWFLYCLLGGPLWGMGQGLSLGFAFGEESLEKERVYSFEGEDLQVETLRFYLADVCLMQGDEIISRAKKRFYLVDWQAEKPQEILWDEESAHEAEYLSFWLGIDSTTSVSGVFGGDLDPTQGMYWAWQSGYINFKLEGTSPLCSTRDHAFQLHIGGYQAPFATQQKIVLPIKGNSDGKLIVDVRAFLSGMDLQQDCQVMSPNAQAVELSKLFPSIFRVEP